MTNQALSSRLSCSAACASWGICNAKLACGFGKGTFLVSRRWENYGFGFEIAEA
jgi:hypothetical protein